MGNAQASARVNSLLLLVIGLLVGVIAGYMFGRSENPGRQSGGAGTTLLLNDRITAENQWIVAGMNCPEPGCTNTLLECNSNLSRQVRNWVNQQLDAGVPGQEIRRGIIQANGATLFKTFPWTSQDSL